ncbi:hypothetical protein L596_027611 [Steinernema carpocapsae]|uniref:Pepsin inhibitor-3-like repeated domain-containing protein n=1 Tax=Steinernema carpocapsae TaxID=34508 RepID=A0A4U5LW00_STECR|nr:hypothetical protein L596_027611 [Steinernema carpocapsae]
MVPTLLFFLAFAFVQAQDYTNNGQWVPENDPSTNQPTYQGNQNIPYYQNLYPGNGYHQNGAPQRYQDQPNSSNQQSESSTSGFQSVDEIEFVNGNCVYSNGELNDNGEKRNLTDAEKQQLRQYVQHMNSYAQILDQSFFRMLQNFFSLNGQQPQKQPIPFPPTFDQNSQNYQNRPSVRGFPVTPFNQNDQNNVNEVSMTPVQNGQQHGQQNYQKQQNGSPMSPVGQKNGENARNGQNQGNGIPLIPVQNSQNYQNSQQNSNKQGDSSLTESYPNVPCFCKSC